MSAVRVSPLVVDRYRGVPPPFGFSGLGMVVYVRTYSRTMETGRKEEWYQTVERVCNGIAELGEGQVEPELLQDIVDDMYPKIFEMKVLPPGRGLWAGGTSLVSKGLGAALFNCAFVSTETSDPSDSFTFLMDAMMLGIGVGFDTRGAGKIRVYRPNEQRTTVHTIQDSRESWVQSLRLLLSSFFIPGRSRVAFNYERVRPKGLPLRTFGGESSGPEPLRVMHERIRAQLDRTLQTGEHETYVTSTVITDLMNIIGACIVAGNVRRGAEIALGSVDDAEFANLKNYTDPANAYREAWSWASNNSVMIEKVEDYEHVGVLAEGIARNGEPGFFNLINARGFGRMADPPNDVDREVRGVNPCGEIGLHHKGLCNLVEINMDKVGNDVHAFQDLLRTALLYAMITTMAPIHWTDAGEVQKRTRRLGIGLTGVAEFLAKHDISIFILLIDTGYKYLRIMNDHYAAIFGIERSCKLTTVKPSGTVSLLAGVSPGMHFPLYEYYERRVLIPKSAELVPVLVGCGYAVEDSVTSPDSVCAVFPVKASGRPIGMAQQFELLEILQTHWADNAVSATITFTEEEAGGIRAKIAEVLPRVKGFSMLKKDCSSYAQAPYTEISRGAYEEAMRRIDVDRLLRFSVGDLQKTDATPTVYCDGDRCTTASRE